MISQVMEGASVAVMALASTHQYAKRTNATSASVPVFAAFADFRGLVTAAGSSTERDPESDQYVRTERCALRTTLGTLIDGDRVKINGKVWTVSGTATSAAGVYRYEIVREIARVGGSRTAP